MKAYKKIVIAGGSGQFGKALCKQFSQSAEKIIILSRSERKQESNIHCVQWDGKTAGSWTNEIDGADAIINLTGKNINCRYTEKNKKEIIDSRINSIKALSDAISKCNIAPKLWIQASSIDIYKQYDDRPATEETQETGEGFLIDVSKIWEKTFIEQTASFQETRKVILRISLLLSKDEGVFPRLKKLTLLGLGGKQGNGKQWVSWIHETDAALMVDWIASHEKISGVINCASPSSVRNKDFMSAIRSAYKMPIGIPSPSWLLEIGAFIIRTEAGLILTSRWAVPNKILATNFHFQYPEITEAIKQLKN